MNTSHALVRFLQPGRTDAATCEDTIVATDAFKAVIDGTTSKTDFMVRMEPKENETFAPVSMTGGKFVAEVLAEYIRAMPTDIDFERFAEGATAMLDKALQAVSWPETASRRLRSLFSEKPMPGIALLRMRPIIVNIPLPKPRKAYFDDRPL